MQTKKSRIELKKQYLHLVSIFFFVLTLLRPIFFYSATSIGCRGSEVRLTAVSSYYVNLQCALYAFELFIFALVIAFLILDLLLLRVSTSWADNRTIFRLIATLLIFAIFLDLTHLLLLGDKYGSYRISEGYLYYAIGLVFHFGDYKTINI